MPQNQNQTSGRTLQDEDGVILREAIEEMVEAQEHKRRPRQLMAGGGFVTAAVAAVIAIYQGSGDAVAKVEASTKEAVSQLSASTEKAVATVVERLDRVNEGLTAVKLEVVSMRAAVLSVDELRRKLERHEAQDGHPGTLGQLRAHEERLNNLQRQLDRLTDQHTQKKD